MGLTTVVGMKTSRQGVPVVPGLRMTGLAQIILDLLWEAGLDLCKYSQYVAELLTTCLPSFKVNVARQPVRWCWCAIWYCRFPPGLGILCFVFCICALIGFIFIWYLKKKKKNHVQCRQLIPGTDMSGMFFCTVMSLIKISQARLGERGFFRSLWNDTRQPLHPLWHGWPSLVLESLRVCWLLFSP